MTSSRPGGRASVLLAPMLSALLVALAVVPPARAEAPAGSPAAAPLRLDGTPVTPSAVPVSAPILSSGRYLAPVPGPGGDTYLQVRRTIPRSTIWVGATLDLGAAAEKESFDGDLFLRGLADGNSGQECWSDAIVSTDSSVVGGQSTPRFETWLQQSNGGGAACRSASSITLELSTYQWTPPAGTKVQVVVWEEPPVGDVSGLQAPTDNVTWNAFTPTEPAPLRPGTTWSEAPDISEASVSFHLARNSVAVFRMPLGWGQHGQALVSTAQKVGSYSADLAVWWASPMGGSLRALRAVGAPGDTSLGSENGPSSYGTVTPTVNYRNRETVTDDSPVWPSVAGDYYLVVYAGAKDIPADGVDLTLQSGFYTDYAAAAPPYAVTPTAVTSVNGSDSPSTGSAPPSASTGGSSGPRAGSDGGASGGGVPWPAVLMLFGGAAVFAVLGAVALGLGRRRS